VGCEVTVDCLPIGLLRCGRSGARRSGEIRTDIMVVEIDHPQGDGALRRLLSRGRERGSGKRHCRGTEPEEFAAFGKGHRAIDSKSHLRYSVPFTRYRFSML
jgi:hypothetical protein